MKPGSNFRKLNAGNEQARVRFGEAELFLTEGENLAAELLVAGVMPFRHTPVSGAPRNPYCMMGTCFDCLVEIDGITRQACMMKVEDGLAISMPNKEKKRDA